MALARDIVAVVAWRRADFLTLTLEKISNADRASDHHVIIALDRGFSRDVLQVATEWKHPSSEVVVRTSNHGYYGNSFNVLETYRYALTLGQQYPSQLIYMIEEDIWVARDFFTLSQRVHAKFKPFAFCAAVNQPASGSSTTTIHKPPLSNRVYAHPFFQSYGVSFPLWAIARIMRHAHPSYYEAMDKYIKDIFQEIRVSRPEQDGLITQIMRQEGYQTLYPYVPRAMHAGFVGYNRPGLVLGGNLRQRIEALRAMSIEDMNHRALMYKDIQPCNFDGCADDNVELELEGAVANYEPNHTD